VAKGAWSIPPAQLLWRPSKLQWDLGFHYSGGYTIECGVETVHSLLTKAIQRLRRARRRKFY
jgi:hypothetical protein